MDACRDAVILSYGGVDNEWF